MDQRERPLTATTGIYYACGRRSPSRPTPSGANCVEPGHVGQGHRPLAVHNDMLDVMLNTLSASDASTD
ncbi:MAG: hypothetical protein ACLRM8_06365 [Alistipes sp.]